MSIREEIRKLGWRIRYVPHEVIKDFNACYRVEYKGRVIYPPAADELDIPLNDIWLSELLKEYEEYVLFHEFREILYRYQGYNVKEARLRARIDEALRFRNNPKWIEYFEKFPDYSIPLNCLKELCRIAESDVKTINILYKSLIECIDRQNKIKSKQEEST